MNGHGWMTRWRVRVAASILALACAAAASPALAAQARPPRAPIDVDSPGGPRQREDTTSSSSAETSVRIAAVTPDSSGPGPQAPGYFYAGRYFTYDGGLWYQSERPDGPWSYAAPATIPSAVGALPRAYRRLPKGHLTDVGPHPWTAQPRAPRKIWRR